MTIDNNHIGKKVNDAKGFAEIMAELLRIEEVVDRNKEHVWVIGLSTKLSIQYIELVSLGILNSSLIHAREVFRNAIFKGVASIICVHNHPSGELTPSTHDFHVAEQLRSAGDILGIPLIDNIIINEAGDFSSLKAMQLM